MCRLSLLIVLLFTLPLWSQSPHGKNMKIDCAQCHNPGGWTVDFKSISFNHSTTQFPLEGTHKTIDCKACHTSLDFQEVESDCISCHTDVHEQSVGNDCVRCHSTQNWLVFNIPEIHESNGFPLTGSHFSVNCIECHQGESGLIFHPLGNECIECHQVDYASTTNPNHMSAGFSEDCTQCHSPNGFGWSATGIVHDFFPLTGGHNIQDCSRCHDVNNFSNISSECFSCHSEDYASTTNPNHSNSGFSTDCVSCHTTNPGWTPATFDHDGQFFPIYSGPHRNEWNSCTDCHINPSNYSVFTCLTCHTAGETSNDHDEVSGYVYESNACLQCHPDGRHD